MTRAAVLALVLLGSMAAAPVNLARPAPASGRSASCAIFRGMARDGQPIVFEDHAARYVLRKGGNLIRGDLNTERGWKKDRDATLFILDWRGPEERQIHIVRRSGVRDLLYLGQGRGQHRRPVVLKPLPDALCTVP